MFTLRTGFVLTTVFTVESTYLINVTRNVRVICHKLTNRPSYLWGLILQAHSLGLDIELLCGKTLHQFLMSLIMNVIHRHSLSLHCYSTVRLVAEVSWLAIFSRVKPPDSKNPQRSHLLANDSVNPSSLQSSVVRQSMIYTVRIETITAIAGFIVVFLSVRLLALSLAAPSPRKVGT